MRDGQKYAQEMYEECAKELKQLGYRCADKVELGFEKFKNHNMFGWTEEVWNENGETESYLIHFSTMFLDERVPETGFCSIMFHELLHTIDNYLIDGHEGKWLLAAQKVEEKFPHLSITTMTREALSIPEQVFLDVYYKGNPKIILRCSKCGRYLYRMKPTNFTKNPEAYPCGRCGGVYKIVNKDML